MKKQYLEIGKIVNTHGIAGDVKVQPWCDSPSFLAEFDTLYWETGEPLSIQQARVHKGCVILRIEGVDSIDQAETLRNRVLYMNRDDVTLPEDLVFIQDILGYRVFDQRLNRVLGTLSDVLQNPANDIYVVRDDAGRQYLIPAVPAFLQGIDHETECITVRSIEGMYGDED